MRTMVIAPLFVMCGCSTSERALYDEILARPSSQWSSQDCFSVIAISASYNYFDARALIRVMAIPYYPSVILAIQRSAQSIAHWPENIFRANTDTLMADAAGMFVDWEHTGRVVDSRGNYFKSRLQMDVLELLITVDDVGWPRPDITQFEKNIFLENDGGQTITPRFVWGRRQDILNTEETLFARFQLRQPGGHFFQNAEKVILVVRGYGETIRLGLPLWMAR